MPNIVQRRSFHLLLALLSLFVAVVLIGTGYILDRLKQEALDKHFQQAGMHARLFENYLTHHLNAVELTLGHSAELEPSASGLPPIGERLHNMLRHSPSVRSISWFDGHQITESSNPRNIGSTPTLENLLPLADDSSRLLRFGVIHEGRDFNRSRATTAEQPADLNRHIFVPVLLDSPGTRSTHNLAALNPDFFLNYFLANIPVDQGVVDILRYDGVLLFSTDERKRSGMQQPLPATIDLSNQEFGTLESIHQTEPVLTAFRASRRFPLVVLIHIKRQQALAEWHTETRVIGTGVGLALLLIIIAVSAAAYFLRLSDLREEATRRQRRLAAKVYEASDEGIMITDAKNRIVSVNPAFSEITGYSFDEVYLHNPGMLSSGQHDKAFYLQMWSSISEEGSWKGEIINRHKDGRLVQEWLNISRLPESDDGRSGFVGVFTDITAARQQEVMLHQLSLAVEQSPSSVLITDLMGNIEYANSTFCTVTGLTAEEIKGKSTRILKSGLTPPQTYVELWQTLTAGDTWEGEFINRRKDGTIYFEHALISPLLIHGRISHYVAVKHDITEMRTLTENLRQARDAAETANRAKSAFIANMSHELRTPLNAIMGYTYILKNRTEIPEEVKQLEVIEENASHLLLIINDVLDMAALGAGRLELNPGPVQLSQVLSETATLFRSRASEKGLAFQYTPSPDLPSEIEIDKHRLRQILTHLLTNAVAYTSQGKIRFGVSMEQDDLVIRVGDSGPGIASEKLETLFQPFRQSADNEYHQNRSMGLGLPLTGELVHTMGGKIEINTKERKGSQFTVRLPVIILGYANSTKVESIDEDEELTSPVPTEIHTRMPQELIDRMKDLSRRGRIIDLRQTLSEIEGDDELANRLLIAADKLDLKLIRVLLEQCINE